MDPESWLGSHLAKSYEQNLLFNLCDNNNTEHRTQQIQTMVNPVGLAQKRQYGSKKKLKLDDISFRAKNCLLDLLSLSFLTLYKTIKVSCQEQEFFLAKVDFCS